MLRLPVFPYLFLWLLALAIPMTYLPPPYKAWSDADNANKESGQNKHEYPRIGQEISSVATYIIEPLLLS